MNVSVNDNKFKISLVNSADTQNVTVTEQNIPVREHNVPLREHNVPLREQNIPVIEENVPVRDIRHYNVPLTEGNIPVVITQNVPVTDIRQYNVSVPVRLHETAAIMALVFKCMRQMNTIPLYQNSDFIGEVKLRMLQYLASPKGYKFLSSFIRTEDKYRIASRFGHFFAHFRFRSLEERHEFLVEIHEIVLEVNYRHLFPFVNIAIMESPKPGCLKLKMDFKKQHHDKNDTLVEFQFLVEPMEVQPEVVSLKNLAFKAAACSLRADEEVDDLEIPSNLKPGLKTLRDSCHFLNRMKKSRYT